MSTKAIIKDGIVINVIVADDSFPAPDGCILVETETAGPGWTYVDGVFSGIPSLAERRIMACEAVDARREVAIAVGCSYSDKVIDVDQISQSRISSMAIRAGDVIAGRSDWPAYYQAWITADNTILPLATAEDGFAMAVACEAFVAGAIINAATLKAMIRASEDPASIDIEAGWPA